MDANVYGVAVPGADGRAGMAEIVCSSAIDFCAFREHLARHLPKYAHPVLLLIRKEIDVTPTFKQLKQRDADGYDLDRCSEALYVNDPDRGAYVAMDRKLYDRIRKGPMQLQRISAASITCRCRRRACPGDPENLSHGAQ